MNEISEEWERTVKSVKRKIVCARLWDDEVRAKIEHRRQVYRFIASGQGELWEKYYILPKEIKHLVLEK